MNEKEWIEELSESLQDDSYTEFAYRVTLLYNTLDSGLIHTVMKAVFEPYKDIEKAFHSLKKARHG